MHGSGENVITVYELYSIPTVLQYKVAEMSKYEYGTNMKHVT